MSMIIFIVKREGMKMNEKGSNILIGTSVRRKEMKIKRVVVLRKSGNGSICRKKKERCK